MGLLDKMQTTPSPRSTNTCERCGSSKVEMRPLFTGMYKHCASCDGSKAVLVVRTGYTPHQGAPSPTRTGEAHDCSVGDVVFAAGIADMTPGETTDYATCNMFWDEASVKGAHRAIKGHGKYYGMVAVVQELPRHNTARYKVFKVRILQSISV